MARFYVPLDKSDYETLDKGGEIKCPYRNCKGRVCKKLDLNGEEIYTEFELDNSVYYECSKNHMHVWGFRRLVD